MMQSLALPLFSVAVLAGQAMAEPMTGAEIKALFTGNTIAGVYVNGGRFSEYHAPDGRALGDNGYMLNVDACWNVDQDKVCYHYGPAKERKTYCFTVEQEGESIRLKVADTGRINAVARMEQGNPRGHGDGGRRWSCDDLLSQAFSGETAAALHEQEYDTTERQGIFGDDGFSENSMGRTLAPYHVARYEETIEAENQPAPKAPPGAIRPQSGGSIAPAPKPGAIPFPVMPQPAITPPTAPAPPGRVGMPQPAPPPSGPPAITRPGQPVPMLLPGNVPQISRPQISRPQAPAVQAPAAIIMPRPPMITPPAQRTQPTIYRPPAPAPVQAPPRLQPQRTPAPRKCTVEMKARNLC